MRSMALRSGIVSLALGIVAILTVTQIFTSTTDAQVVSQRPVVSTAVKFDVSPPLRDIKPNLKKMKKGDDDQGQPGPVGDTRHDPDPAIQTTVGQGVFNNPDAIPPIGTSFNGMSNSSGATPPDPNGDIGPNHYVQMVNTQFQIFNRSGTSLFGPANINTLFSGFGGACETQNSGDPVVLYDQLANRWLLSQFTSSSPFFNCVAVSQTSDPTGAYYRYAFSTTVLPDYPKYGIWPDGYYLNTRESGNGVLGLYALERDQMLLGNPAARNIRFTVTEGAAGPNGLLPADLDGFNLPPAGSPEYFLGTSDNDNGAASDALILYKFHVDWVTTANSTLSSPTTLSTSSFDSIFPCTPTSRECIPQPGTTVKLDILSYRQRPTFRLAYRNFGTYESLVTLQSVEAVTGIAGMRWWEVRSPNTSPTIFQEGTFAPGATDNIHRWMGSIAMDRLGNMGMAYSASDATSVFPGIRYTGRLATDPAGQMPQGEGIMMAGGGSQTSTGHRWGDYSSMSVDPTDDCTFWYTTEYYATTSATGWNTRIASFKFPNCTAAVSKPPDDFDGDGKTDISIFRPGPGEWWYLKSSNGGNAAAQFGTSTDRIVPGDFTGDSKTDMAFWRPSTGEWFVLRSENFSYYSFPFGTTGDVPMPADYDGDGKADAAVFRPSNNTWYINKSSGGTTITTFGTNGDVPVAADYDGDGKGDIAIFRPSNGQWWISRSTAGVIAYTFGSGTDKCVPGDYTGDGKADVAFWRPSTGEWFVLRSEDNSFYSFPFGTTGDVPSPGDYDGDGKFDASLFRPSTNTWYVNRSTAGVLIQPFGTTGDISVPNAFVR